MPKIDWFKLVPHLIKDQHEIQASPFLCWVTAPELVFSYRWLIGGYLPLADVLQGWADGSLLRPCPDCKLLAYVISAIGGNGTGGWRGVCLGCQRYVYGRDGVMEIVLHPRLRNHLVPLGYSPVVAKRDPWRFSFKRGAYRRGSRDEDEYLPVPSWNEFLHERYPEVLTYFSSLRSDNLDKPVANRRCTSGEISHLLDRLKDPLGKKKLVIV
jgi:hypothetical protein